MTIGIGCDLVEHKTAELLNWSSDVKVLNRIFSTREIELYSILPNIRFLAGRFAAKEAVLKCLGTGMQDGISLLDIQILKSENDKPVLILTGKVLELSNIRGISNWHITVSHTDNYSLAFVIAEC